MTAVLLFDGRRDEEAFQMMQGESSFPRLLGLIKSGDYDGTDLHMMLLELLCEMSRIQQLPWEDLSVSSPSTNSGIAERQNRCRR